MFDEEFKPRKKSGFEKRNLTDMSEFEIDEYVAELKEEIIRAEADKARKKASREAAASVFKS